MELLAPPITAIAVARFTDRCRRNAAMREIPVPTIGPRDTYRDEGHLSAHRAEAMEWLFSGVPTDERQI